MNSVTEDCVFALGAAAKVTVGPKGRRQVLLSLMRDNGIAAARAPILCVPYATRSRGSCSYDTFYGRGFYAQELSVVAPPHARKSLLLRFIYRYRVYI